MSQILLIALYIIAVWLLLIIALMVLYSVLLVLLLIGLEVPTCLFRSVECFVDALIRPGICINDFLNLLPCYRNRALEENNRETPDENVVNNEPIESKRDIIIIINPDSNPTLGTSAHILPE